MRRREQVRMAGRCPLLLVLVLVAMLAVLVSIFVTGCDTATHAMNGPTPTSAELRTELLTLHDLSTGWTRRSVASDASPDSRMCGASGLMRRSAMGQAEADFARGGSIVLEELIAGYAHDPGAHLDQIAAGLDACHSLELGSSPATMRSISFPTVGDRSAAYQLRATVGGVPFAVDVVLALKGNRIVATLFGGVDTPPTSAVEAIVRQAVAKVR